MSLGFFQVYIEIWNMDPCMCRHAKSCVCCCWNHKYTYIYRIINTHSNSTSMLYSPCCLTIIKYVWCYWPKLWMPTNPTSVWSGPVASHFSAATVGSFSLLHTSRIHPGNLTAKWWLEDLVNLLKWSFFRGIGRVEDIHMDIYMHVYYNYISNSHQQKLPRT